MAPAYDHAADDAGRGTCNTGAATSFEDPDDGDDGETYYYLVTALGPCGIEEGTTGFDAKGGERPPRNATASCP